MSNTASEHATIHAQQAVTEESRLVQVNMTVNGRVRAMTVEARTTLLDALRDELGLTGTKKACDRGECGACTVHLEGRRVLSCMTLAAMQNGKRVTTIEGLERDSTLHPVQAAFIEHDGFPVRILYLRADHVGRRHDRRGEGGPAERRHGGCWEAIHRGGSVRR